MPKPGLPFVRLGPAPSPELGSATASRARAPDATSPSPPPPRLPRGSPLRSLMQQTCGTQKNGGVRGSRPPLPALPATISHKIRAPGVPDSPVDAPTAQCRRRKREKCQEATVSSSQCKELSSYPLPLAWTGALTTAREKPPSGATGHEPGSVLGAGRRTSRLSQARPSGTGS
ncbi:uncharacterized protein RBU33_008335 isoform 1-T1 [Hipposideros larvatus]